MELMTAGWNPSRSADDSFEQLYRAHFPAMMRVAFVLTGSNAIAEDIVQDVFERCASRLDSTGHPASYLRAAVVNGCRSHHRRRQMADRRTPRPASEATHMPTDLVELRDALLVLPIRQRTAVVLRYLCDLDDTAIAATLGCRVSTVRSMVHRGLARLREVIE